MDDTHQNTRFDDPCPDHEWIPPNRRAGYLLRLAGIPGPDNLSDNYPGRELPVIPGPDNLTYDYPGRVLMSNLIENYNDHPLIDFCVMTAKVGIWRSL